MQFTQCCAKHMVKIQLYQYVNHLYYLGFNLVVHHWVLSIVMAQICFVSWLKNMLQVRKKRSGPQLVILGCCGHRWHRTSGSTILTLEAELRNNTSFLVVSPVNAGSSNREECPNPFEFRAWSRFKLPRHVLYLTVRRPRLRWISCLFFGIAK